MNSMTGYGLGYASNESISIKVEMKSVNNRYCDINIRLPKSLFYVEDKIKNFVKKYVYRGKIDIFINLDFLSIADYKVSINTPLAKEYYTALEGLKNDLNLKSDISLSDIYSMQGVIVNESEDLDENIYMDILRVALNEAVTKFVKMRNIEGENIKISFEKNLEVIKSHAEEIKRRAPLVIKENTDRLKETIRLSVDADKLDLARLSTEVALMCDKLSIDEEITRVFIHLEQFNDIINRNGAIGRKLDFLVQELNREVNTIGSKTSDIEILNLVVELKSEIEKIREQIQNIE
ncbi:YicC/YloC family endoribonuclease [Peptoniphilus catoniae]|uniref:YicC/YloC family endoribonuclease n=1 Tax=Peptoniphilus catoniae TaxID=1660341 RepID=UPI0010FCF640|nr:YicC/YloC family endoribonuclease [Peptoniphilus catoniae]